MAKQNSIPDLVAAARVEVATLLSVGADIAALTHQAVDLFSLFEKRMQHHFRRGPFSRKLTAQLRDAGHPDLGDRLHQYYLAINVLKHGKGASHRELLKQDDPIFAISAGDDGGTHLIDATDPAFFDGLTATILAAHDFLENQG